MPSGVYKRTKEMKTGKHMLGRKMSKETRNKMSLAKRGNTCGFKKGEKTGENHPRWKGDNIEYRGIHHWITKELGKPRYCEHCKNSKLRHRQYNWANKSGEYKRNLKDWLRLCVSCHKKYDNIKRKK